MLTFKIFLTLYGARSWLCTFRDHCCCCYKFIIIYYVIKWILFLWNIIMINTLTYDWHMKWDMKNVVRYGVRICIGTWIDIWRMYWDISVRYVLSHVMRYETWFDIYSWTMWPMWLRYVMILTYIAEPWNIIFLNYVILGPMW